MKASRDFCMFRKMIKGTWYNYNTDKFALRTQKEKRANG